MMLMSFGAKEASGETSESLPGTNHLRTLKSQSVVVCSHEGTDKTLKLCLSLSNIDKIYVYRLEFFSPKWNIVFPQAISSK